MGKDPAPRIELGRSFHQIGIVNEKVQIIKSMICLFELCLSP